MNIKRKIIILMYSQISNPKLSNKINFKIVIVMNMNNNININKKIKIIKLKLTQIKKNSEKVILFLEMQLLNNFFYERFFIIFKKSRNLIVNFKNMFIYYFYINFNQFLCNVFLYSVYNKNIILLNIFF